MAQNKSVDPTAKPYTPINTDMVDDLEHYALDKIRVMIEFVDHSGTAEKMNGLIGEVFTKDHAEFLRMSDGRTIRLDQIRSVAPHVHK